MEYPYARRMYGLVVEIHDDYYFHWLKIIYDNISLFLNCHFRESFELY
jgi:hypothetical protein